nr:MAG TPA: hypothetical protein [Caudoviricetes sp.]
MSGIYQVVVYYRRINPPTSLRLYIFIILMHFYLSGI